MVQAEKTQRSIAQTAFDAGEHSPPWIQATSRLVLQTKSAAANLGGSSSSASSQPATPTVTAGAAVGMGVGVGVGRGEIGSGKASGEALSTPSTPSSGSVFSVGSSLAAASQVCFPQCPRVSSAFVMSFRGAVQDGGAVRVRVGKTRQLVLA